MGRFGWAEDLWEVLFPSRCPICGRRSAEPRGFCGTCLAALEIRPAWRCLRCGAVLPSPGGLCHRRGRRSLDALFALGGHGGTMREAVHRFKYHGGTDCGAALGILLARHAAGVLPRADLVVPVPLARRRQRIRGYNQASLLAGHLAGTAAARLEADLLARTRETAVQADLSPGQRRHNLRGAVALRRPRSLEGLALLLVDDVYTTGATMEECSRVLKGAGATAVTGAVVACAALRDAGSGAVPDPPETGIMNS